MKIGKWIVIHSSCGDEFGYNFATKKEAMAFFKRMQAEFYTVRLERMIDYNIGG